MGPLVSWIVRALEAAMVGGAAGVLAKSLTRIGIPKASEVKYEHAINGGKFAVVVHGTAEMVVHARAVLGTTGALKLPAHAA